MTGPDDGLYAAMLQRGITRRAFLKFSSTMAATLALPAIYAPRIAEAVAASPRIPVIWLRGQDCSGNTMAFLRAAHPPVSELILELLSIDYHETIMAPAGAAAEQSKVDTMAAYPDQYIAVLEGGIPTADDGVYCTIGGRAFRDVAREVCDGALATIGVGTCAFDGGSPAAGGGPTGATGASSVVSGGTLISLPGCPVNTENLTATIVHYLTFKKWPDTDAMHRPYFAYGALIHNQCERRPHYEYGEYALAWGDEGAQKGWCLYKMGCKGPETFANCPTVQYGDGTSWPVRAGHGCVGCHMPGFWDAMSPFYSRLPAPIPFVPQVTVDQLGQVLVAAVAAGTVAHGAASYVRDRRGKAAHRHEELAITAAGAAAYPSGLAEAHVEEIGAAEAEVAAAGTGRGEGEALAVAPPDGVEATEPGAPGAPAPGLRKIVTTEPTEPGPVADTPEPVGPEPEPEAAEPPEPEPPAAEPPEPEPPAAEPPEPDVPEGER
jgi:hydrogenase small subunit